MAFDSAVQRKVMGRFATGVTVVTTGGPMGRHGLTANAVASLSLEPLLLLVAFDNTARTLQVVRETERFGVNVLGSGQEELARLFASKAPEDAKFAEQAHVSRRALDALAVVERRGTELLHRRAIHQLDELRVLF